MCDDIRVTEEKPGLFAKLKGSFDLPEGRIPPKDQDPEAPPTTDSDGEYDTLAEVTDRVMTDPRTGKPYPSRSRVFLTGLRSTAMVCLQALIVLVFLFVLFMILGELWPILLPVLLAIIVSTVLWPMVRWMRRHGTPPALASLLALLVTLLVIGGVFGLIIPSVISQAPELADHTTKALRELQEWAQKGPLEIDKAQIDSAINAVVHRIQSSASTIASGVFTGVGAVTSALITGFTALVLVFFFLKDGPKFLPWVNRTVGAPTGSHIAEVMVRMWNTLSGFIRTQAIVSAVDAALIGAGLLILNVPLAFVLILITFLGGFIPIVGAFVAGALAVVIALVTKGLTTALIVLGIILLVQQLEGNVLSPWLQSKAMELHAVVVLLAVILGGGMFGIIGAFLAVPAASCLAVLLRYILERVGLAAGEKIQAEDAAAGVLGIKISDLDSDAGAPAPEK